MLYAIIILLLVIYNFIISYRKKSFLLCTNRIEKNKAANALPARSKAAFTSIVVLSRGPLKSLN